MKKIILLTFFFSASAFAGCLSEAIRFGKSKGMYDHLIKDAANAACVGHVDSDVYQCMSVAWKAYSGALERIKLKASGIACSNNRSSLTVKECLMDGGLGLGSYWDYSPATFCRNQQIQLNAFPVCTLDAREGHYAIYIGDRFTGNLYTSLESAAIDRNNLVKIGTCRMPTQLPNCYISNLDGHSVIFIGDHFDGVLYSQLTVAIEVMNAMITHKVCVKKEI